MKRYFILLIIFFSSSVIFAQDSQNAVVALEVIETSPRTATVRWKSNLPEGEFTIYFNNVIIKDKFALYDSEVIVSSNFSGENIGSQYQYEYEFTFNFPGIFYFAVVPNNTSAFDRVARVAINEAIPQYDIVLIPELNTTTQPIHVRFAQTLADKIEIQKNQIKQVVITSLELRSTEDIFNLRWSVFPKTESQYVFVIYRSRFPIVQYGSPTNLPEYARVTNQFYFEDKNIGFETPYYYAVVSEHSTQWDVGINVFSQPAVMLRESTPLHIKPTVEYVKQERTLSINTNNYTEEEIQLAVQQTLSNLYQNNNVVASDNLSLVSFTNISDFQRGEGSARFDSFDSFDNRDLFRVFVSELKSNKEIYTKKEDQAFREMVDSINKKQNTYIGNELKLYTNTIKSLVELSNDIKPLAPLEGGLLLSDKLSEREFQKQLNEYYTKIDQIHISQYNIQTMIKNLNRQKTDFIDDLKTSKVSLEKTSDKLKIDYKKDLDEKMIDFKQRYIDHEKKQLEMSILESTKTLEILRSQSLSKNITLQTKNTEDFMRSLSTLGSGTEKKQSQDDMDLNLIKIRISKEEEYLQTLLQQKEIADSTGVVDLEDFDKFINRAMREYEDLSLRDLDGFFENQIVKAQSFYREVVIEQIPDISEMTNEKWLVKKEDWLAKNQETWLSKHKLWQRRIEEILGGDYYHISSKWSNVSQVVAIQEGKKAFLQKNYKEAVYLLYFATKDHNALMALGQSYYHLGAYRDAFSVFVTTLHMGVPESRYWMDLTAGKILDK